MLIERKQFGFCSVKALFKEDLDELRDSGKYSSIVAMSYKKVDIEKFLRTEKTTALIDLTETEADIFKKFNDTTRNEINKTLKDSDFGISSAIKLSLSTYKLYSDFEFSQGRVPVSIQDLKQCVSFEVSYKGELLSAILILYEKPYIRIRSIFSKRLQTEDRDMYKHISNATRRAMWEICLWGKRNGYISVDLASVNLTNPKTANITRFKMSFGGSIVPEYTYTYKTKIFEWLEVLARARVWFRKTIIKS